MMFCYEYDDVAQEVALRRLQGKPSARRYVVLNAWKHWRRQARYECAYPGLERLPGRWSSPYRCAERSEQRRLVLAHVGALSEPQRILILGMLAGLEGSQIGPRDGRCRSWAYREFEPACRAMRQAIWKEGT
jgi:hypothetical protein